MFSIAPGTCSHCVPGTSRPGSLHHSAAFSVDSLMQNHATLETRYNMGGRVTNMEACLPYRNREIYLTRESHSASISSSAAGEGAPAWQGCSISEESRCASSMI